MKKFAPLFFAVMLALAVMLLPVVPASARTSTLYVDDDYTVSTPGWGVDHFATIQAATDTAYSGDTIIVYPGTYTENVDVDKSVTIQSQNGASETIVDASTTHSHAFNITAINVTITGFTLRGATATGKAGIYLDHVQSCNISANTCLNNYYGINLDNSSNNTLTSNISNSNTKDGIYLDGSEGSHGNILDGNTANQNGECGIYVDNGSNNTLTSNSVTGNNIGVALDGSVDASTISINFNTIHSNTQHGVENSGSGTADATSNWWGANNGPSHTSNPNGTGDAVSDNVNYDPWHLKQIGDLTAGNATDGSIDLFWTTAGAWDGDYFDIRYSTSTITSGNWNSARRVADEPTPSTTCNASQGMKVTGLSSGTTYYFGLKLIDADIGSSEISNIASATTLTAATAPTDTTPPGAITDLAVSLGTPPTTKAILSWTAKGDDGTAGGIAAKYIIKRSTSNITADNFDSATTVYNDLAPKANGDSESFTAKRLSANTTYYFAIKIQDEVPNTSATSNVVSITTANLLPTVTNISPTTADNGQARTLTITGTNFASSGTTVVRLISDDNTFELTSVTYVSETQLTAMVPQGVPTGTYKARVINNNGTLALSSATYTVTATPTPLPVVTNVIPQMGTNDAATSVKIVGENLTGASAVILNDQSSTSLAGIMSVSADGTEITGLSIPSGVTAGEYNVKVTTAAGTNGISTVKFKVCTPIVITTDTTQDITSCEVVNLETNVIPVEICLTTDNSETATQVTSTDAEIEVILPPQTTVTTSEGNDYIGNINPPRVVKPDESILTGLAEDSIIIEMGNPEETIHFDQDFVATITLTSSTQPLIWYYNKTISSYELAGKTGTKDGVSYARGGTVLNQADTLYTVGLLLDHMSNYIVGVPPAITDAPESATAGTNITITGTNFDDEQAQVYFNGTQGTVVSRAVTQIVVTVPKFYGTESSTYTLKVENSDGLYDTTSITITPLSLVPTLTWWGTVAMIALFGSLLIFMLRRRLIHQL